MAMDSIIISSFYMYKNERKKAEKTKESQSFYKEKVCSCFEPFQLYLSTEYLCSHEREVGISPIHYMYISIFITFFSLDEWELPEGV